MQKLIFPHRSGLRRVRYRTRQIVQPELIRRIQRRHQKRPIHRVDQPYVILRKIQVLQIDRPIPQVRPEVFVYEHRPRPECPQPQHVLVRLTGKIRPRRIPRRKQNLVDLLQVRPHIAIVLQARIHRHQPMPLLRPRKQHRFHRRRKPLQRLRRRTFEDVLRPPLGLRYAHPVAHEYVLVRQYMPRNIRPVGLPVVANRLYGLEVLDVLRNPLVISR
jgi:hypothetical protein